MVSSSTFLLLRSVESKSGSGRTTRVKLNVFPVERTDST